MLFRSSGRRQNYNPGNGNGWRHRGEKESSASGLLWAPADLAVAQFTIHDPRSTIHDKQEATNRRQSMSVLLETSLGDITIDLLVGEAPKSCQK